MNTPTIPPVQSSLTIFRVTGYYEDAPDDFDEVFMSSEDEPVWLQFQHQNRLHVVPYSTGGEPSPDSGYTDEDIYFYGVSAESLDAAIRDKEELGGFIPTSWEIEPIYEIATA